MIPFICFENASFSSAQHTFFEHFNWAIQQGENWIITGKIGSGKTSLVQALSGKFFLSKGKLDYPFLQILQPKNPSLYELKKQFIKVVSFKDDSRTFDPHVFFYQQRFNSFADGTMTVWEYLIAHGYSEYQKEQVDLIKRTGIFELLDLERIKLSSGQARKLLITKAILQKPKLLIIDNPYLGLDAGSRREFNQLLDHLVEKERIQLILAGQYEMLPRCISHRLHLDNFQVGFNGKIKNYSSLKALSGEKISPFGKRFATPVKAEIAQLKKQERKKLLSDIQSFFKTPNQLEQWRYIFQLKNINIAYYGKEVLNKINWAVKPGEKWALIGANGSGKSTLLSLLFGDHPQAYSNEIYLFDHKRGMGQSVWDIKKRIGYTSPELHYFFSYQLTAEETIATGLFDHFYLKRKPKAKEQELINLLMAYFSIGHLKGRTFQSLSTGEQRLILLIRALIKNPPLILLDEPFQGFDLEAIEHAKQLLNTILSRQHTLVFISHYEREIPKIVEKRLLLK